jgi:hypothetical protein
MPITFLAPRLTMALPHSINVCIAQQLQNNISPRTTASQSYRNANNVKPISNSNDACGIWFIHAKMIYKFRMSDIAYFSRFNHLITPSTLYTFSVNEEQLEVLLFRDYKTRVDVTYY